MVGWVRMPLGMVVGLGPGDFVLDGNPAPLRKGGEAPPQIFGPCLLWPNGGWIKMPPGMEVGLSPGDFVLDRDRAPSPKGGRAPKFSADVYCGQTAGWIEMALGMEVGLSPGDFALDGDPDPDPPFPKGDGSPSPMSGPSR